MLYYCEIRINLVNAPIFFKQQQKLSIIVCNFFVLLLYIFEKYFCFEHLFVGIVSRSLELTSFGKDINGIYHKNIFNVYLVTNYMVIRPLFSSEHLQKQRQVQTNTCLTFSKLPWNHRLLFVTHSNRRLLASFARAK